ncbi:MAG TPA: hypothetical protein VL737_04465 [Candidatus Pristimantibacillus sp.]|nr:hypothetical protein [Candidatus Pristimantibacillus sp.]
MQITSRASSFFKRFGANKLALGCAAVVASAIVGTTGLAAAHGMNDNDHHQGKPDKQHCLQAGFRNYGQCVKEWAHHKNHPGGGYNGNTAVTANVNLEVNHSNNNVITVILNFFRS